MDGTKPCYTNTFASRSEDPGKFVDHNTVITALDFNSPRISLPKGSKRKCSNAFDQHINSKDECSLVLGLGPSSSSCTTICSGNKEMEHNSSIIDLGLSINPNSGDNKSRKPKTLDARRPILDLQLSLSTGPAESDVTTITPGFIPYQNYSESPAVGPTFQQVDEGSISSRWKTGPSVTPLQNIEVSTPKNSPTPRRKTITKTCRFSEGCTRGARGASGLCISHGGGRRCQKTDCKKGAEGKTVFCKSHGGGRRCHFLGCTKSAEGKTDHCISHGGGARCQHTEGCSRASRGKSGLCIRHGGGNRCGIENCTKSAEGISGLCISHGGGKRCQYSKCGKGAQGSTMFCKAHGGGRRCEFFSGCTKGAEGSTGLCKAHGGGRRCAFGGGCGKSVHGGTLFCVGHGGGKRCAVVECTKSARGRTSYCVRHGGGKRCGFGGGCGKSAQGSTDFCKAHGGGRRCGFGGGCDKFARGKFGMCAAHGRFEEMVGTESSGFVSGNNLSYPGGSENCGTVFSQPPWENFVIGDSRLDHLLLPEGRVHGGSLMAMLRRGTTTLGSTENGEMEPGKSYHVPHSWV